MHDFHLQKFFHILFLKRIGAEFLAFSRFRDTIKFRLAKKMHGFHLQNFFHILFLKIGQKLTKFRFFNKVFPDKSWETLYSNIMPTSQKTNLHGILQYFADKSKKHKNLAT